MKAKNKEGEIESDKLLSEKSIGEKPVVSPPLIPKIPFPQRLAKPNLEFNESIISVYNILFESILFRFYMFLFPF